MLRVNNLRIPLDSVLGPTLFNLYVNDITLLNLNSKTLKLYSAGDDLNTVLTHISDINQIYQWPVSNRLTVSVSKTQTLLIAHRSKLNSTSSPRTLVYTRAYTRMGDFLTSLTIQACALTKLFLSIQPIELMHRKAAYKLKTV